MNGTGYRQVGERRNREHGMMYKINICLMNR